MLLASWNVNGLRAILAKGHLGAFLAESQPDVLCLQETKARPEQVELPLEFAGYHAFWNSAEKPGYSGTAVFSRLRPAAVHLGLGSTEHDREGRVITLEFPGFHLVNVYTPNAQDGLRRLAYRTRWDQAFCRRLTRLAATGKPVVFCGDLNVAHQEIDLARPQENRRCPGFTDEERAGFTTLLAAGFTDTFRHFHPDQAGAYTWWSFRGGARSRNVGWRIDYFGVSNNLTPALAAAAIHPAVHGSDHCPVTIRLDA